MQCKYYLLILMLLFGMAACKKETTKIPSALNKSLNSNNTLLLLKVDYISGALEGGLELKIKTDLSNADSIPLIANYDFPGDFGNLTFLYQPSKDTVFDGSIVWMGTGKMKVPYALNKPESFEQLNTDFDQPDSAHFQFLRTGHHEYDYYWKDAEGEISKAWKAISKLEKVETYLKYGKKVGLFLYNPSAGGLESDTKNDWLFVLSK